MSTPTVTADIQHPSARESVTRRPTDQFARYQVVRVFLAEGLDTGADNQAGTMLDRALLLPGIPQLGALALGAAGAAGAVAISRATLAIPQSDNSCYVLVTYENPLPGAPVAFLVSDDTSLTVESTQLHPRDKSFMLMTYQAPDSSAAAALQAAQGNGAVAPGGASLSQAAEPTKNDPGGQARAARGPFVR